MYGAVPKKPIARRTLNWFLTDTGKTCSFAAATAISITTGLFAVVPHTICLDKYKKLIHSYKHGLTVPVNAVLLERFARATELAEIHPVDIPVVKPFTVIGFELCNIGTTFSRYGAAIGLPVNFFYEDEESVDRDNIKLQGESIFWETDAGKDFLSSLIMSESAQIYGMTRELKMVQTPKIIFDTINAWLSPVLTYISCSHINKRLNLYTKPLSVRLIMYTLCGMFFLTNHLFLKDSLQNYYEQKVDEQLRNIPELREGAIEYYSQILKRNIAVRTLLGKEGEHTFTVNGNDNYTFRQRHVPLVHRKSLYENM